MVDSSMNDIAQSLPINRSKMPALFFGNDLAEDFGNQEHKCSAILPNLTGNTDYYP